QLGQLANFWLRRPRSVVKEAGRQHARRRWQQNNCLGVSALPQSSHNEQLAGGLGGRTIYSRPAVLRAVHCCPLALAASPPDLQTEQITVACSAEPVGNLRRDRFQSIVCRGSASTHSRSCPPDRWCE